MSPKTNGKSKLKVVLVNHSDSLGGASVVTYRLMNALRDAGVDARMVVYTKTLPDENISVISNRFRRGTKFLAERVRIFLGNGLNREKLFMVSIANTGTRLEAHPWIREADVICLNWINQGMLSLAGVRRLGRLGKPIVWTMHDMWTLTGICHHALECDRYKKQCGHCPFLGSHSDRDLSRSVWEKKRDLYDEVPIHFVPVSNWLAEKARESSLLKGRDITVIPNAFPVETFSYEPIGDASVWGIDTSRRLILFGAARIDDPIKGLGYTIDALNFIFDDYPEIASSAAVVFFGDIRDRSLLDRIRFSHFHAGRISDQKILRSLYSYSDVVLSTSLYETLPGTLIEGMAAGCLPVTFGEGGQSDIVEHLKTGYIAHYKDPEDVARGIMWALAQKPDRRALHEEVSRRFAAPAVAARYLDLFNRVTR